MQSRKLQSRKLRGKQLEQSLSDMISKLRRDNFNSRSPTDSEFLNKLSILKEKYSQLENSDQVYASELDLLIKHIHNFCQFKVKLLESESISDEEIKQYYNEEKIDHPFKKSIPTNKKINEDLALLIIEVYDACSTTIKFINTALSHQSTLAFHKEKEPLIKYIHFAEFNIFIEKNAETIKSLMGNDHHESSSYISPLHSSIIKVCDVLIPLLSENEAPRYIQKRETLLKQLITDKSKINNIEDLIREAKHAIDLYIRGVYYGDSHESSFKALMEKSQEFDCKQMYEIISIVNEMQIFCKNIQVHKKSTRDEKGNHLNKMQERVKAAREKTKLQSLIVILDNIEKFIKDQKLIIGISDSATASGSHDQKEKKAKKRARNRKKKKQKRSAKNSSKTESTTTSASVPDATITLSTSEQSVKKEDLSSEDSHSKYDNQEVREPTKKESEVNSTGHIINSLKALQDEPHQALSSSTPRAKEAFKFDLDDLNEQWNRIKKSEKWKSMKPSEDQEESLSSEYKRYISECGKEGEKKVPNTIKISDKCTVKLVKSLIEFQDLKPKHDLLLFRDKALPEMDKMQKELKLVKKQLKLLKK